jgi:hypothetical protein
MIDSTSVAFRLPKPALVLSCALLLGALAATPVSAQTGPDVLVLGADNALATNDVTGRLQATALFGSVTQIDARTTTPTLAQLQAFQAVITWSNYDYADSVALGDVLADYVDAGGGVIVATFTNCETYAPRYLRGRWLLGNYEVIISQSGFHGGAASLGVVHVPGHPIMAGVSTFDGNFAYRALFTNLASGALDIADWTDGTALVVAHGTLHNRVDFNFYPPSQAGEPGGWLLTTDGTQLTANALLYVAGNASTATTFCSGDGSGTACPCGNPGQAGNGCSSSVSPAGAHLAATGQASIATDSVVLHGSGMPNSSALYFQGTTQLAAGQGLVFGDGLRCAGGSIIRLKAVINAAGASHYPGPGDPSVSVRGSVTVPGTRTYQVWYRNAAPFCTPSTFNLTNGAEIAWAI